jgi:pimeloyl-ACP methyl ester carboxylesterase
MATGYSELRNERVGAANGVDYAYRDTGGGEGTVPLILLQHFRGNLDNWDPALIGVLAPGRRVVTFDNAGVGGSTGTTPDTIEQMARDAIAFIAAMQFSQADLLGFSIGSFIAQQIALVRPAIVRRLILASSAPQGAAGMHGWAPEVIGAIGTPKTSPDAYLEVFFTQSASSQQAGQQALRRMYTRTEDRDAATTWATREAQYDAVCTWGIPNHALLQRLSAFGMPVFVANGDSDPMILPHYSYLPYDPGNRHAASFIAAIAGKRPAGMPGQAPLHEKHPSPPLGVPSRRSQGWDGGIMWWPTLCCKHPGCILPSAARLN